MEIYSAYIPLDRRQAIVHGRNLPDRTVGAALFADISGFTPLTEALTRELGPQRGVEELTVHLNAVYDSLIAETDRFCGSVIGFSGDAITCWFEEDNGKRAIACALAMQAGMKRFSSVVFPSGRTVSLAMKTAVAAGRARRFLVGDPDFQVIDVLAGEVLDRLSAAEEHAGKGEVLVDFQTARELGDGASISEWRQRRETNGSFGVVESIDQELIFPPWPPPAADLLTDEQVRPWILPVVYDSLKSGQGEFLTELRPNVALFLRFQGLDYDEDEAAGNKLNAFICHVQRILAKYEATLIQVSIGDKGSYISTAFGAPIAHEDDAIRAVSAAMEIRDTTLESIRDIQIGICQGKMRTGAYGGITRRTYGMMGDEVNLAARLMMAARPGQILASKTLYQSTIDLFKWQVLPAISVKGKSEPVNIYSLIDKRKQEILDLQETYYSLPMVGRKDELAQIEAAIHGLQQGVGRIFGMAGEAGMGKSRLVVEVIRMASKRGVDVYGGECQSYGTNISYLLWQAAWRGIFGLDQSGSVEQQIELLEDRLQHLDPALLPRMPLLATVLNLTLPDNDLTRSFDAKLRKSSLEALLADCLRLSAKEKPILLVLEDCHWIDALSQDLLEVLGRAISDVPVLILVVYRSTQVPDMPVPGLMQLQHFKEIQLREFSQLEAEELIRLKLEKALSRNREIPTSLVRRITTRAEGNPFYIEELLNYLQDKGLDPNDDKALERLDLPSSLQSLILSRMDQLTESQKITIKVASVVGRVFKAAMLWGSYPALGDPKRIRADLEILSGLGMTPISTAEPELTYFFKHIITQEAAYSSLPYAMRAILHGQIGHYVEKKQKDSLDQFLYLLAHHYDLSDNLEKKREYLLKAGKAAQAEYANAAAIDYYNRVLPLLAEGEQLPVLLKLGQVMELVGKWAEANEHYQRALNLSEILGDRPSIAWSYTATGELLSKRGNYADASEWFQRAQTTFEELGDVAGQGQALHYAGTLAARQGDFDAARNLYERSLEIRRELEDGPNIASLLSNLGILARFRGEYDQARSLHEESLAIRRGLGDRWAIAVSLNNLGNVALDQKDNREARARLEEALALIREVGDRWSIANSLNNLGNVARAQGDYQDARQLYRESLAINYQFGDKRALAYILEDIGCLAALENQPERAFCLVGSAQSMRQSIGSPLSKTEQEKLDHMLEPARQALEETARQKALAAGRAFGLDQAIDYAMRELKIEEHQVV